MATITAEAGGPAHPARRRRWPRNALIAVAVLVALVAVLGFVVVPRVAKSKIEALAQADLGRHATIGKVAFNPFTLHARLTDFRLADRDPARTLFAFSALDVRVSLASLWTLAPVIDAVTLTKPELNLARGDDGRLDVQDLVDRPASASKASTPEFSVDNIEIIGGTVTFDDRMHQRVVKVTDLGIGIPFLSSFPHDAKIRVTPHVDGVVDGSRFALSGSTNTPFSDVHEATLALDLDALKLPGYASYITPPNGLKLASGALTTRLKLAFVTGPSGPRTITLSGKARLDDVAIGRRDGSTLAGVKSLSVDLAKADFLAHAIAIDRIDVDAPHADLRRGPDGQLEIARLFGAAGDAAPAPAVSASSGTRAAAAPASPWTITAAAVGVRGGGAEWTDASVTPVFHAAISNLSLDASGLANRTAGGSVKVALDSDLGAHVDANATLDVPHEAARGSFAVSKLALPPFAPYYAQALDVDLRRGTVDVSGAFDVAASTSPPRVLVSDGKVSLDGVEAALRRERQPLWTLKHADATGIAVDPSRKSVAVERLAGSGGTLHVVRLSDGTLDFERIISHGGATGRDQPRATPRDQARAAGRDQARAAASDDGTPWAVTLRHAEVDNVVADVEDRAPKTPVRVRLVAERIAVDDFDTAKGAKSRIDAAVRVGKAGRVRAAGGFALAPVSADLRVDARKIDLVAFDPYVEGKTNVVVTRGVASAKGRLRLAVPATGPVHANWTGSLEVADFDSLDRPESQELLRWKSLALTGVDVASEPLAVGLGTITLDDFYARIILNANATLNLQQLLTSEPAEEASNAARTTAGTATAGTATLKHGVTTAALPATPGAGKALPVSIASIRVTNGEVEYSDFFVKPNYETHLTQVTGSVSAVNASLAGDVALAAKVQGTAPVDIHGTINPFADNLHLDLTATASDVDLPPMSPYSIKYAGYGIEKGKLSMQVHYKVDDRKLAASNKLRLDQLTFGAHVDSPTATKLPVLLAVALLTDAHGVINLDLPIEGTLDDPKFSIWHVIVQVFVNLITKAVAAPFALLGSLAGGAHEELSWVGFAPGHADLAKPALDKLETLAKALADRPALRLDVAGRVVPDVDRPGLERVRLERAMRARKAKDLAAEGASAPSLDEITISPAEYPKYLAAVYRDAKIPDKPRNFLGIARDVPPAQMEALLLASYRVDDAALTALANSRADAVKVWLTGPGKIDASRIFVVAPKVGAEGVTDKGVATRVDFALRR
ncbi:MAG TPA: DUF748 domain-containing protein [Casimicrobiaceae bacterium]